MAAHPGSVFVFPAARELIRNHDVHFPFRQDSNFHYLSGFDEPDAILVLTPPGSQGRGSHNMVLFVRRRDPEKEMWEGERYGTEGALSVFGADEAYPLDELDRRFPELLKDAERVFYRMGLDERNDRRVVALIDDYRRGQGRSGKGLLPISDPSDAVGELRLYKRPEEVEFLRKAGRVSARAHRKAMQETRPGMNESDIEALIEHELRRNGCQRLGYGSIIAGGRNSTCLHYHSNNETLRDGELLLIDSGGEVGSYTADITRTFPVGRKFSPAQARIYDLVLKAQLECVSLAKPGAKLPDIHKRACEILIEGMLSLGLLKGDPASILKEGTFRRFYPHGTGHWLGMDVHDAGLYTKGGDPRPVEPGMCFTIEPGFYVQPADREAPEEYRNIGIRIEDDILITEQGCEVLTSDVPKAREEVEALRRY